MKVLISRLSALGDVVCTLPAAVAIRRSYPEAHVTWACDPRFAGIVDLCNSVDEVVRVKPGFKPSSWPSFEQSFDYALDLQGLAKSGLVVARAKAKKKIGYHWQRELAPLFSQRVIPDPTSFHVVDQYVDVARAIGVTVHEAQFDLVPRADERVKMAATLKELGVTDRFVVMNGGAGWVTKRWPPKHFAVVAEMLAANGIQSVFIGGPGPGDRAVFDLISAGTQTPLVDLVGKTSVTELVALISLANAHLGGDTGSTHVAAALGVPAVGLYSITKPLRTCPYGQVDRCHYHPDGLAEILPGEVFETLGGILG
jgi:heptosyltransferase I